MGDADLTYDFRELLPFVDAFRKGAEFVMGSRFRGSIEKRGDARFASLFWNTSYHLDFNRIYDRHYSDIHCGMRGLTRAALDRIDLKSQFWASRFVSAPSSRVSIDSESARISVPAATLVQSGRPAFIRGGGLIGPA